VRCARYDEADENEVQNGDGFYHECSVVRFNMVEKLEEINHIGGMNAKVLVSLMDATQRMKTNTAHLAEDYREMGSDLEHVLGQEENTGAGMEALEKALVEKEMQLGHIVAEMCLVHKLSAAEKPEQLGRKFLLPKALEETAGGSAAGAASAASAASAVPPKEGEDISVQMAKLKMKLERQYSQTMHKHEEAFAQLEDQMKNQEIKFDEQRQGFEKVVEEMEDEILSLARQLAAEQRKGRAKELRDRTDGLNVMAEQAKERGDPKKHEKELAELQGQIDRAQETIAELNTKFSSQGHQMHTLEMKVKRDDADRKKEMQLMKAECNQRVKQLMDENDAAVEEAAKAATAKICELELKIRDLEDYVKENKRQLDNHEQMGSDGENQRLQLEGEIMDLKGVVSELKIEVAKREHENVKLGAAHAAELEAQGHDHEAEMANQKTHHDEEIADLKQKLDDAINKQPAPVVIDNTADMERLERDLQISRDQFEAAKLAQKQVLDLAKEREQQLQEDLAKVTAELQRKEGDIELAAKMRQTDKQELERLKAEHMAAAEANHGAGKVERELREEVLQLQDQLLATKSELMQIRNDFHNFELDSKVETEKLATAHQERLEQAASELAQALKSRAALEAALAEAEGKLEAANAALEQCGSGSAGITDKLSLANSQLEEQVSACNGLREQLAVQDGVLECAALTSFWVDHELKAVQSRAAQLADELKLSEESTSSTMECMAMQEFWLNHQRAELQSQLDALADEQRLLAEASLSSGDASEQQTQRIAGELVAQTRALEMKSKELGAANKELSDLRRSIKEQATALSTAMECWAIVEFWQNQELASSKSELAAAVHASKQLASELEATRQEAAAAATVAAVALQEAQSKSAPKEVVEVAVAGAVEDDPRFIKLNSNLQSMAAESQRMGQEHAKDVARLIDAAAENDSLRGQVSELENVLVQVEKSLTNINNDKMVEHIKTKIAVGEELPELINQVGHARRSSVERTLSITEQRVVTSAATDTSAVAIDGQFAEAILANSEPYQLRLVDQFEITVEEHEFHKATSFVELTRPPDSDDVYDIMNSKTQHAAQMPVLPLPAQTEHGIVVNNSQVQNRRKLQQELADITSEIKLLHFKSKRAADMQTHVGSHLETFNAAGVTSIEMRTAAFNRTAQQLQGASRISISQDSESVPQPQAMVRLENTKRRHASEFDDHLRLNRQLRRFCQAKVSSKKGRMNEADHADLLKSYSQEVSETTVLPQVLISVVGNHGLSAELVSWNYARALLLQTTITDGNVAMSKFQREAMELEADKDLRRKEVADALLIEGRAMTAQLRAASDEKNRLEHQLAMDEEQVNMCKAAADAARTVEDEQQIMHGLQEFRKISRAQMLDIVDVATYERKGLQVYFNGIQSDRRLKLSKISVAVRKEAECVQELVVAAARLRELRKQQRLCKEAELRSWEIRLSASDPADEKQMKAISNQMEVVEGEFQQLTTLEEIATHEGLKIQDMLEQAVRNETSIIKQEIEADATQKSQLKELRQTIMEVVAVQKRAVEYFGNIGDGGTGAAIFEQRVALIVLAEHDIDEYLRDVEHLNDKERQTLEEQHAWISTALARAGTAAAIATTQVVSALESERMSLTKQFLAERTRNSEAMKGSIISELVLNRAELDGLQSMEQNPEIETRVRVLNMESEDLRHRCVMFQVQSATGQGRLEDLSYQETTIAKLPGDLDASVVSAISETALGEYAELRRVATDKYESLMAQFDEKLADFWDLQTVEFLNHEVLKHVNVQYQHKKRAGLEAKLDEIHSSMAVPERFETGLADRKAFDSDLLLEKTAGFTANSKLQLLVAAEATASYSRLIEQKLHHAVHAVSKLDSDMQARQAKLVEVQSKLASYAPSVDVAGMDDHRKVSIALARNETETRNILAKMQSCGHTAPELPLLTEQRAQRAEAMTVLQDQAQAWPVGLSASLLTQVQAQLAIDLLVDWHSDEELQNIAELRVEIAQLQTLVDRGGGWKGALYRTDGTVDYDIDLSLWEPHERVEIMTAVTDYARADLEDANEMHQRDKDRHDMLILDQKRKHIESDHQLQDCRQQIEAAALLLKESGGNFGAAQAELGRITARANASSTEVGKDVMAERRAACQLVEHITDALKGIRAIVASAVTDANRAGDIEAMLDGIAGAIPAQLRDADLDADAVKSMLASGGALVKSMVPLTQAGFKLLELRQPNLEDRTSRSTSISHGDPVELPEPMQFDDGQPAQRPVPPPVFSLNERYPLHDDHHNDDAVLSQLQMSAAVNQMGASMTQMRKQKETAQQIVDELQSEVGTIKEEMKHLRHQHEDAVASMMQKEKSLVLEKKALVKEKAVLVMKMRSVEEKLRVQEYDPKVSIFYCTAVNLLFLSLIVNRCSVLRRLNSSRTVTKAA
jgi:hypothetical protein